MTEIDVDGSLLFRFDSKWRPARWDGSPEQLARHRPRRKSVDIIATGAQALLVEVKDDRLKAPRDRREREQAAQSGVLFDDIAQKVLDSVTDVLDVAAAANAPSVHSLFASRWKKGRRQFVFWWELPPEPPSGRGTRDDRWKAALSAHGNVLRQRLRGQSVRVHIANQRFGADVVEGMEVIDQATGLARRRRSLRSLPKRTLR